MLFRGDIPLSKVESLVYEAECELRRMRDDGHVMETIDSRTGESVWTATLRGSLEFGRSLPMTFDRLDSSC
jgi:hypothetical protein